MVFTPRSDSSTPRLVAASLLCVFYACVFAGCAGRTHTVRVVHSSVYEGLDIIKEDAKQAREEALARYDRHYDRLVKFAPLIVEAQQRAGHADVNLADTLAGLETEREEFNEAMALDSRIVDMADQVKRGLGWTEGPRNQFEEALIGVGAAGVGIAAGAAF